MWRRILTLMACAVLVSACFSRTESVLRTPTPGFTPAVPALGETPLFPPLQSGETPAFPPTDTPAAELAATLIPPPAVLPTATFAAQTGTIGVYIGPTVPIALQEAAQVLFTSGRFSLMADEALAQVKLISLPAGTPSPLISRWVYVAVVPFASVAEEVTIPDIQRFWRGDTAALSYLSQTGQPPVLVVTAPILAWLTNGLGPAAPNVRVETASADLLAPRLWELRDAWSILPFEQLNPTLKALRMGGISVLSRNISVEQWPMVETFGLTGDPAAVIEAANVINAAGRWLPTNRDPARLTALIVTGVTALTRATAYQMEVKGITAPAAQIAPFLAEADLLHTSNEVSFAKNCPKPNFASTTLIFCSRESYFELLRHIGLDVVELTGNHVNDWGVAAMNNSLDLYDAAGIRYFGGGRDAADARKGLRMEHNGNKIAFIGCNPVGPRGAWATDKRPGAAPCDDAFIAGEIAQLKAEGYFVVMTLQYQEYYQYTIPAAQQNFFRKYAAFGADAVIGSQAHQPQGFGFTAWQGGTFIHFGVGNLFFDQMQTLGTRQMFADKLVIYGGRHLQTELFTGLIESYCCPRPMTPTERRAFLTTIFRASGW